MTLLGVPELMPKTSSVLGMRIPRIQGMGSVTGEGQYVSLMRLPGMVFLKTARTPYPRARIVRIDSTRAEAVPGVVSILHRYTIPDEYRDRVLDPGPPPRRLLQTDVVQMGMPIAVVAAESEHAADDAIDLIEVEYEVLTPSLDYVAATGPDAPKLWDNPNPGSVRTVFPSIVIGDPEGALARSHAVVHQVTTTPFQHHMPVELRTGIYWWEGDTLVTYLTTHEPYLSRDALARAFELRPEQVRLIQTGYMGSSFGLADPNVEDLILPALMAKLLKRPVRCMHPREDGFLMATHRGRSRTEVRLGVARDGRLTGVSVDMTYDGGANAGSGDAGGTTGVRGGRFVFQAMYDIPDQRHDGLEVFTNTFRAGPMRGVGRFHGMFAVETAVEKAAYAIGMDPLALRLLNLNERGMHFNETTGKPPGRPLVKPGGQRASLLRAAEMIRWSERWHPPRAREVRPGVFHGIAIVSGTDRGGGYSPDGGFTIPSTGQVVLRVDGTLEVISGSADQGAGQRTLVAMIAAHTSGIPLDRVVIAPAVDTTLNTDTGPTHASFQMNLGGWGVLEAAQDAKRQLLEEARVLFARRELGPAGDALDVRDGDVFLRSDERMRIPVRDVMARRGRPITGRGDHQTEGTYRGERLAYGAHAGELEVDTRTGTVRVLRYVAVHDVGRILNRLAVEQQSEGGVIFGLGSALYEELLFDEATGIALNPNVLDYKPPSILDFPRIELDFVEIPQDYGPYGALAIGQGSATLSAPLVVNAVYNAVGVWIHDLPVTRKRVRDALAGRSAA